MNDPYSQTRIRYFSVFIHNIIKSFVESQTKTLLKQNKPISFDQKIYEWIIAFTYPTIEELNEVAIEVNASCGECLAGWLFNMISCAEHYEEVTAEKIAEYIFVYKDHLSIEHFAHLMRLYSSKIRSKALSSYPFDDNVNNNIDRPFSRTEDEVHIPDTIRFNIPNASNVNPLNPKS